MKRALATAVVLAALAAAAPAGAAAGPAPAISSVAVGQVGAGSAVVTWPTATPATSWVELGTTQPFGSWTPGDSAPGTSHQATLTGLSPATAYTARLVALDAQGQRTEAATGFTTAPIPPHTNATTRGSTILLDGQPFFPIMAWGQCADTLDQALAAGVDVFLGGCLLSSPSVLEAALAGRAYSVLPVAARGTVEAPGLIGWNYPDESDGFRILPDQLPDLPPSSQTGQLSFLTLSVHFWSGSAPLPIGKSWYPQYYAKPEVLGFDVYPLEKFCGNRWTGFPTVYDAQRELAQSDAPGKPTYQWIEAATMDGECLQVPETAHDLRAEVWEAIAGGARAIGYFTHSMIDNVWKRWDVTPELQTEMARTDDDLRALAPGLLGGDVPVTVAVGSDVRAGARTSNGAVYVIAVNPTTGPETATLTVAGLAGRQATVLDEGRTVQAQGDTITDSFGPRDAHVYVFPPAWTQPAPPAPPAKVGVAPAKPKPKPKPKPKAKPRTGAQRSATTKGVAGSKLPSRAARAPGRSGTTTSTAPPRTKAHVSAPASTGS